MSRAFCSDRGQTKLRRPRAERLHLRRVAGRFLRKHRMETIRYVWSTRYSIHIRCSAWVYQTRRNVPVRKEWGACGKCSGQRKRPGSDDIADQCKTRLGYLAEFGRMTCLRGVIHVLESPEPARFAGFAVSLSTPKREALFNDALAMSCCSEYFEYLRMVSMKSPPSESTPSDTDDVGQERSATSRTPRRCIDA